MIIFYNELSYIIIKLKKRFLYDTMCIRDLEIYL